MRSRGGLGSLRGVEEVSFFKLSQKKLTFILPPGFFIFYFCFNGQMFKIRALLLFTFGFLVCSVKSDSASGCCASWYGMDAKPCTDCTNTFNDANNFICRNSIQPGLVESTSGKDCISFTVSESECSAVGLTYISASSNNGMGCPANTSDTTSASSSGITLNGLLGMLSASMVAFALL